MTSATISQAVVPVQGRLTKVATVLAGTLLVAAAAQIRIPLPFTPVPITGQTFGVLLVGAALGPALGASSLALYLLLGGVGLPFYSGATGGWEVAFGTTGGYLMGFIVAAWVVGALAARGWDRDPLRCAAAMVAGNIVVYAFGVPWLAWRLGAGAGTALELGMYPFLIGDALKIVLAALALPGAWRLLGTGRADAAGRVRRG
jgi:biotin transport system substrate-specific component